MNKYTDKDIKRFWSKVSKSKSCWLWKDAYNSSGYGRLRRKDTKGHWLAHRMSYELSTGHEIPEGLVIRHQCHNRPCVNPEHLLIGTIAENVADSVRAKRHSFGERHSHAKLTEADVQDIRRELRKGAENVDLAQVYNTSAQAIYRIKRNRTWRLVS